MLLSGSLSGPNPWRVAGSAEFRILGVKKSFAVDESFGELANEGPPEEADPAQLVREALALDDASSCLPPAGADPVVLDRPGRRPGPAPLRASPGDTAASCRSTPSSSATATPTSSGPTLVAVDAVGFAADEVEDVVDWFASAQFFLLSQTEKLTAPSFTQMKAGLVLGGSGADAPHSHDAFFDHEIAYRDPLGRLEEPRGKTVPYAARDEAMTRALETRGSTATTVRFTTEEPLWLVADPGSAASTGAVPAGRRGLLQRADRHGEPVGDELDPDPGVRGRAGRMSAALRYLSYVRRGMARSIGDEANASGSRARRWPRSR